MHTHQRKRSSLQSIGFRPPTSVAQDRPNNSPRPARESSPTFADMDQFVQSLPADLVHSLARRSGGSEGRASGATADRRSVVVPSERPLSSNARNTRISLEVPSLVSDAPSNTTSPHAERDPMTVSSLKASYHAMHMKRRVLACCLLALRLEGFDAAHIETEDPIAVARYWADVHQILMDLQAALLDGVTKLDEHLADSMEPGHKRWITGTTDSFAPRPANSRLLQHELGDIARLLANASERIQDVRRMASRHAGDHVLINEHWMQLRTDLGAMINHWEKGKVLVERMTDKPQEPGFSRFTSAFSHRSDEQPDLDKDANTSADLSLPSIPSNSDLDGDIEEPRVVVDDASSHLLSSTSPAHLPPPGIEAVFEDYVARLPTSKFVDPSGKKLSRQERIELIKAAREQKASSKERDAEIPMSGGLGLMPLETKARGGAMVSELKNVIDRIRHQREGTTGDEH